MSKKVGAVGKAAKNVAKVVHPPYMRLTIPAGEAAAGPPLGPQLGQRGIQIGAFCKQFNEKTSNIKPGIPIPTRITVNETQIYVPETIQASYRNMTSVVSSEVHSRLLYLPEENWLREFEFELKKMSDRTFDIQTTMPPSTYFLKMAAGIKKGAMKPAQEVAGKVSLKHIYEIAKIKSQDEAFDMVPMEEICRSVIGTAHSCGIQVVKEIKPEEYGKFLEERKEIVAQQEKELEEQRQAKMLRL